MMVRNMVQSFSSVFVLAACANDPNKEVRSAQEAKVEDTKETRVTQANVDREHTEMAAATNKEATEARAKMTEERRVFVAEVDERLAKADILANEMVTKSRNDANKKNKIDGDWNTYQQQRRAVLDRKGALMSVPDETWSTNKRDTERSLDDLENTVSAMKKKF